MKYILCLLSVVLSADAMDRKLSVSMSLTNDQHKDTHNAMDLQADEALRDIDEEEAALLRQLAALRQKKQKVKQDNERKKNRVVNQSIRQAVAQGATNEEISTVFKEGQVSFSVPSLMSNPLYKQRGYEDTVSKVKIFFDHYENNKDYMSDHDILSDQLKLSHQVFGFDDISDLTLTKLELCYQMVKNSVGSRQDLLSKVDYILEFLLERFMVNFNDSQEITNTFLSFITEYTVIKNRLNMYELAIQTIERQIQDISRKSYTNPDIKINCLYEKYGYIQKNQQLYTESLELIIKQCDKIRSFLDSVIKQDQSGSLICIDGLTGACLSSDGMLMPLIAQKDIYDVIVSRYRARLSKNRHNLTLSDFGLGKDKSSLQKSLQRALNRFNNGQTNQEAKILIAKQIFDGKKDLTKDEVFYTICRFMYKDLLKNDYIKFTEILLKAKNMIEESENPMPEALVDSLYKQHIITLIETPNLIKFLDIKDLYILFSHEETFKLLLENGRIGLLPESYQIWFWDKSELDEQVQIAPFLSETVRHTINSLVDELDGLCLSLNKCKTGAIQLLSSEQPALIPKASKDGFFNLTRKEQAKILPVLSFADQQDVWKHLSNSDKLGILDRLSLKNKIKIWPLLGIKLSFQFVQTLDLQEVKGFFTILEPNHKEDFITFVDTELKKELFVSLSVALKVDLWFFSDEKNDFLALLDNKEAKEFLACVKEKGLLNEWALQEKAKLWSALPLGGQDALWDLVDSCDRIDFLCLLPNGSKVFEQKNQTDGLGLLTLQDKAKGWSLLKPEAQQAMWLSMDYDDQLKFLTLLSPEQSTSLWASFEGDYRHKYIQKASLKDKAKLWPVLSDAEKKALVKNVPMNEAMSFVYALPKKYIPLAMSLLMG